MTAAPVHPLGALALLADIPQWIVARRSDKVPLGRAGQPANAQAPMNWRSHDEAAAEVAQRGEGHGLGFVLTESAGLVVIDIDDALQSDGSWSPLAQELCAALMPSGAVVEVSQSGRGLHIWCRFRNPPAHACKRTDQKTECYHEERYILLGRPGAVGTLAEQCGALPAVLAQYFPPSVDAAGDLPDTGPRADYRGPPDTDEGNAELLRMALASRSVYAAFGGEGATFADLWRADERVLCRAYPPSNGPRADGLSYNASSADLALFTHWAFWAGKDGARMVRLAEQSALRRDKWDRADYIRMTVEKARRASNDVLVMHTAGTPTQAPGGPLVTLAPVVHGDGAASLLPVPPARVPPFASVTVADLHTAPPAQQLFYWGSYLPAGFVAMLGGHGGSGKSRLCLRMGVHAALGLPFLGQATRKSRVLYFSAEDPGSLVRARLSHICRDVAADPNVLAQSFHVLDAASDGAPALFTEQRAGGVRAGLLTATYEALRQYIEANSIDLVILDNASDTFDGDEINRASVRQFIQALARLVRARSGAVLLLAHVDKQTSRAGKGANVESYSGSTAWHNSVRSRMFLVETGPGLFELQHQKSNLGPRHEPLTIMWPSDGPPRVFEHAQVAGADDECMRALLHLIVEFASRGEYAGTAQNSRPNVEKLFSTEPTYPRHLKLAEVLAVLRDAERQQLLVREEFKRTNRQMGERFAITDAGRLFLAGASSASSVRRVALDAHSTPALGVPAPSAGVWG